MMTTTRMRMFSCVDKTIVVDVFFRFHSSGGQFADDVAAWRDLAAFAATNAVKGFFL
jgi:hypothetical protein